MTVDQINAVALSALYHHLRNLNLDSEIAPALKRQEIAEATPAEHDAVKSALAEQIQQLLSSTELVFIQAVSKICRSKIKN